MPLAEHGAVDCGWDLSDISDLYMSKLSNLSMSMKA
jgi:hypothetical protein